MDSDSPLEKAAETAVFSYGYNDCFALIFLYTPPKVLNPIIFLKQ